jgi:SpoVK/Ycf46/Vps4 family AAA+-type ATPase
MELSYEHQLLLSQCKPLQLIPSKQVAGDLLGMNALNQWLNATRDPLHNSGAPESHGLNCPKAIALIGIHGVGKTQTALAIAKLYQLPLLKLSIESMFGGTIEQAENNVSGLIQTLEQIAPGILWISEIEQTSNYPQSVTKQGKVSAAFEKLLLWIGDHTIPVFVIVTANDPAILPSAVFNADIYDKIFAIDLPDKQRRRELFSSFLREHKRDPDDFNLDELCKQSEFLLPSEIELAIQTAINESYMQGKKIDGKPLPTATEHIVGALKQITPYAFSQKQQINDLRQWLLDGRAVSASVVHKVPAPG